MSLESYVRNCQVYSRPKDGKLFSEQADGDVIVRLDGYAIIPVEEFEKLKLGVVAAFHAAKNPGWENSPILSIVPL